VTNDLPPDSDLHDLRPELRERESSFVVSGVDPNTGEVFDAPVTRDDPARRSDRISATRDPAHLGAVSREVRD
jgi:hypothetical protein